MITTATASTTKIAFTMESKIAEANKGRRRSALPTISIGSVLTRSRKEMPAVPYRQRATPDRDQRSTRSALAFLLPATAILASHSGPDQSQSMDLAST